MPEPLILGPDDRPDPLAIAGFAITVLADTARTDGYEIFHQAGPEGTGPGPHWHPWDESFYVISGEIECGIDGNDTVATNGTLVHIPGGSTHWYRFARGGGEIISMTSKGNASAMYAEFARESSWENPDRSRFVELAERHGQIVASPPAPDDAAPDA